MCGDWTDLAGAALESCPCIRCLLGWADKSREREGKVKVLSFVSLVIIISPIHHLLLLFPPSLVLWSPSFCCRLFMFSFGWSHSLPLHASFIQYYAHRLMLVVPSALDSTLFADVDLEISVRSSIPTTRRDLPLPEISPLLTHCHLVFRNSIFTKDTQSVFWFIGNWATSNFRFISWSHSETKPSSSFTKDTLEIYAARSPAISKKPNAYTEGLQI